MIRCEDLGCDGKDIKKCFAKYDENYDYSPSFGILAMTEDEKKRVGLTFNDPTKKKDNKLGNVERSDNAKNSKNRKIYKMKDADSDNQDDAGDAQADEESGDDGVDDEPMLGDIEYNVFTRYLLLNYEILLHDSGQYYIYKYNYWQPISDHKLKRILRRFFMKYSNDWSPWAERMYMASLSYDCWELSELKAEEARNYINLQNGLLDIRSFKLKPHDKFIFSTIQIPTEYQEPPEGERFNPKKTCPEFFKFLKTIFDEEEKTYKTAEMVRYMQMVMGYCLSNSVEAHKLWFFLGGGSNGKSVLCEIMTELVGGIESISTVSLDKFKSSFAVSQIMGKTVNIATENEVKGVLNTQLIKAITSGDPIQVEEKFKNPLTYRPTAKLIFSINTMPTITDTSVGLGRRLDIVPFRIRFVRDPKAANERKLIPNIKKKLLKKREGIFAFAIRGLQRLKELEYEFPDCEAVASQRKKIGKGGSLCPAFIHTFIEVESQDDRVESKTRKGNPILISANGTKESGDDLFAAFIGWCLTHKHSAQAKLMSKNIFLAEFRTALKELYGFRDRTCHHHKNSYVPI